MQRKGKKQRATKAPRSEKAKHQQLKKQKLPKTGQHLEAVAAGIGCCARVGVLPFFKAQRAKPAQMIPQKRGAGCLYRRGWAARHRQPTVAGRLDRLKPPDSDQPAEL